MGNQELTLGSLFSGSGGFEFGGILAGITPVFNSEIEPFPVLVTHKRLPEVKHYGDVSTLSGADLEPVDIITFGSPCFPEGTLVLTSEGYLPIEQVEVGMKVLTHLGRWKTVKAAGAKFGETIVLRGNHYGLECTPNHPIYCSGERKFYPQLGNGKRGNQILLTEEKKWIPAENMEKRLWAVPNTVESLPVSSPLYSGSWRQKTMPPLSDGFFYFIGRWLGDGWVCNGQRAGRPAGETYGKIFICDSEDKEQELRCAVEWVTDRYTVSHHRGVVRISFVSQVFAEWLTDNFGAYASGKTMPGWVFGLQPSHRQALINGLKDSDGSTVSGKDNAWRVSTISKRLAESIRLLGEIQGYSTTVHLTKVDKTRVIEGRTVNQHDYYTVVMTEGGKRVHLTDDLHGWYRVRSVTPTHTTKVVYNLTVEDDNSYIADGIAVHNCQDLSIAGKRAGIQDGERSNLFFQAIRIIKEMREKTNGEKPRYCVWENVPGAFSSNGGEDFRAVLEAVIGVKEEGVEVPAPENHRWPKADVYLGDGWSVAYRVLDAQYWGVPQRRSRIYLVGDFAGGSAGEVLFKSEGVSGYTPQGFRAWERTAGGAEEGTGEAGERSDAGSGVLCVNTQGNSGVGITEEKSLALVAQDHGNHPAILQSAGFSTEHSAQSRSIGYEEEKSPTLRAGVVPAAMMFDNHAQDCRYEGPMEQSPTVTARYGTGGNNTPIITELEPVTLKIRSGCEGGGKGPIQQVNKSATLGTHNDQTLFQPMEQEAPKAYGIAKEAFNAGKKAAFNFAVNEEVSPTIQATGPGAVAKPEIKAFGVCSKSSHSMLSDNPKSGFYEAKTSRTLDQSGGNAVTSNQGGICIVAPVPEEQDTFDVRFTSEGTKNSRGHCYKTDISRCLDTSEANPDSNHGGIAVLALEPGAASRVGGHVYEDGKSGTLRANAGDNQQAVVAFTQNQRDEVRDLEGKSGTLQAQPGMKQQTYVLQGSMIGREDKNGPQGDGINENMSFTLNTVDRHAVAAPTDEEHATWCATTGSFMTVDKEKTPPLMARDYKDPQIINDTESAEEKVKSEPMYIVRRLTPVECARLQGFPDWWCSDLAIPDPTDEEIAFWTDVWETWRKLTNPKGKAKTEKQIRKWLADPYTDAAEYKLWGNGLCLSNSYFVLSGIAWAAGKDKA